MKPRAEWTICLMEDGHAEPTARCSLCGETYPRPDHWRCQESNDVQHFEYEADSHAKCLLPWARLWFGRVILEGGD